MIEKEKIDCQYCKHSQWNGSFMETVAEFNCLLNYTGCYYDYKGGTGFHCDKFQRGKCSVCRRKEDES